MVKILGTSIFIARKFTFVPLFDDGIGMSENVFSCFFLSRFWSAFSTAARSVIRIPTKIYLHPGSIVYGCVCVQLVIA